MCVCTRGRINGLNPHHAPSFAVPWLTGVALFRADAYLFSGQSLPPRSHYEAMGLKMNWDASFPWLYHGPWIPWESDRYFPLVKGTDLGGADARGASSATWKWINCNPAGHGAHQATSKPDWPVCVNMSYSLLRQWYR